jgi:hypothetical protein
MAGDPRWSTGVATVRFPDGAIAIHYRNRGRRATEIALFDGDGKVARGRGLYGA